MSVTVKKAVLWRKEVDNRPGAMAETLEPLAQAGADLQVVMGYRYPGNEGKAAIELHPITGRKALAAARAVGLSESTSIASVMVQGDNRPGLGHAITRAIGEGGINLSFVLAQVVGKKYSALFGFDSASEATKAASLIRKATRARGR